MHKFQENDEGVHLVHPEHEGMLCGLGWSEVNRLKPTRKKTVTCRECARLIHGLRTIKYKLHPADDGD
ncbi:hypothetical protein [Pseudodesulfovibrio pelocollis]|uniref:hypothetical protein n=1 Tax=Pseudodesulfovibrio pelocollis TaxID=3051432 RepID=UPI00255AD220|nr:hypothetical protein [Pseudodesulfovibrio sp. SB368]